MPAQFRSFENVNTPILNNTRNKFLMRYNASTNNFDLVSADSLIDTSTDDSNVPDPFVTQLETQIDTTNIDRQIDIDGGTF